MPVATRPAPLPLLSTPSPATARTQAGAPTTGPGSFSNALSQVQPAPTPDRDADRRPAQDARDPAEPAPPSQHPTGADATAAATQRPPGNRPKPAVSQGSAPPATSHAEILAAEPSAGVAVAPEEGMEAAVEADALALSPDGSRDDTALPADPTQPGLGGPMRPTPEAQASTQPDIDGPMRTAPEARAPTHRVLGGAPPNGEPARSPTTVRDALRPIAAHLPAPVTRPGPQLDVDSATNADDEVLAGASDSLSLVGNTRRAAATLGMNAEAASPPSSTAAAAALAPSELSARAPAAWMAEGRSTTANRDLGLPRVEVAAPNLQGWASAPPSLTGTNGNANPAMAALVMPLDHPDFAQALGTQVAIWAADGQHEAELHLNPGHMGPVQVWIGVEGAQAQVRFSADLAPTRDALQAALPQLEQALAREGLQLGGADVQARDPRAGSGSPGNGDADGSRRARGDGPGNGRGPVGDPDALSRTPRPPGARLGLLDLYA